MLLTTRVRDPNKYYKKKLIRILKYLHSTQEIVLNLESDGPGAIKWWVDADFSVHQKMRSHTRVAMSTGKGSI